MAAETLLSRLDAVRQTSPTTWRAQCPAHDSKGLTLSVRELDDGRVLVHCFAGCDVDAVLSSVGLDVGELFPVRNGADFCHPERRPFPASDVLRCIAFEALVVVMSGAKLAALEPFTPEDRERLMLAVGRIQAGVALAGCAHG